MLYWLLLGVRGLAHLLPYITGFKIAGTLGKCSFHLLSKEKEKTLLHLRLAFGHEKSEKELREVGEKVFEHFGQTLFELAMLDRIIPRFDDYVYATGYENFDKGLKAGKVVICKIGRDHV